LVSRPAIAAILPANSAFEFHNPGTLNLNTSLDIYALLERVRQRAPIVHHITNWVTTYDCAQIVKTLGASPVMTDAPEEAAEMTGIASALVLNIGTLSVASVEAMKLAALAANRKGIPVVLDACGAGATSFRNAKVAELLDQAKIDIIKGNASEIARVSGRDVLTQGVDTTEVSGDLSRLAQTLAVSRRATVAITGKVDVVADARGVALVKNGDAWMSRVVGTGCMAASVIGAFAAVESDYRVAAAAGLACYEIAAELAVPNSQGPASLKQNLFDCLYRLDRPTVERLQRVQW
jgi:hydroxyethylthiazole kinase